jgi:hypothetical protein
MDWSAEPRSSRRGLHLDGSTSPRMFRLSNALSADAFIKDASFLCAQAAAIAFSYVHTLEDWFVGLLGTDRASLSPVGSRAARARRPDLRGMGDRPLHVSGSRVAGCRVRLHVWVGVPVNSVSIAFCLPPLLLTATSPTCVASSAG